MYGAHEAGAEALVGGLAGGRARRQGIGVGQEHEPLAPVRAGAGAGGVLAQLPDSGATNSARAAASAADSAATEPA